MSDATGVLLGALLALAIAVPVGALLARRAAQRARALDRRARDAERMAEIGAMTGGLAHELKNPLSTIALNTQLLTEAVDDLPLPEEERARLRRRTNTVRREVERLRDILSEFLRFAGQIHLDPRPADLDAVVDELVDFYLPQAEAAGVKLRADSDHNGRTAMLDTNHFKQALLNLMINATQAMENDPSDRAKELIIRTRTRAGEHIIQVIDTGPGIPHERIDKIFKPYFTTKGSGSGLGLPTTKRLVEEHGGRLEVHSEPGVGTNFTIHLPRRASTDHA